VFILKSEAMSSNGRGTDARNSRVQKNVDDTFTDEDFSVVIFDPKESGMTTPDSSGVVPPPPSPADLHRFKHTSTLARSVPTDTLLQAKEAELDAREREVERRERDVRNKERLVRRSSNIVPLKNWPAMCPMTYHHIRDEIPVGDQTLVRTAYSLWMLTAFCYTANTLIMATVWLGRGPRGLWETLMSALVAIAGIPLSWILWYKGGIYSACKSDGTLRFGWFLFHFSVHIFWMVWSVIAVPGAGDYMAGVFTAIDCFTYDNSDSSVFSGILVTLMTASWLACTLLSVNVMFKSIRRFRGGAQTAARASEEAIIHTTVCI